MNNIYIIIIVILIILNVLSFILGLTLGKLSSISGVTINKPKSFLKSSNDNVPASVYIDDKIYVTDIKTDGMVKKYEDLGEIKQSTENISSSVNKLKQMKS